MVYESVGAQDVLQPGDVFAGRYRIEGLLGQGDRKRTYLAEDMTVGDRRVAISVVKANAVELDPDGARREANLLGRAGPHTHIVAFHDCTVDGPSQYLVFEYLPGGTLGELIEHTAEQGQHLSSELIVRFGRQLAGALAHIHAAGLVHRAVAPHNVWVSAQGSKDKVKLGDFDSAVLINEMPEHRPITSEGYASPEESHGGQLDQRSDLYSLGGVLVSLARAQLGFNEPERLRDERSDFPPALTELLVSLLAQDPDDRPGSAEEVLNRLRQIDESLDLYAVIASGEGLKVEYKASMRFPRGNDDLPPSLSVSERTAALKSRYATLEKSVLKTLAAFLNSEGGTLLIGVEDDGTVVGIEDDFTTFEPEEQDEDSWQLCLKQSVINAFGADVWSILRLTLHRTGSGTVARIEAPPRAHETWLRSRGQEEFYIRAASSSEPLTPSKAVEYIREHWSS